MLLTKLLNSSTSPQPSSKIRPSSDARQRPHKPVRPALGLELHLELLGPSFNVFDLQFELTHPILDVLDLGHERVDFVLEFGLQYLNVLDGFGRISALLADQLLAALLDALEGLRERVVQVLHILL